MYKEERIKQEASYMINTKETVREIAKKFKVSKSTVHKDLHERLKIVDFVLYQEVAEIIKRFVIYEVVNLQGKNI